MLFKRITACCQAVAIAALVFSMLLVNATATAAPENAGPPDPPGSGPAMIWPDLPYNEPVRPDLDPFGGCTAIKGTKTGFFHTEQFGGRWWLVTPEGNAYFLLSMRAVPGRSAARLKAWGFNCSRSGSTRPDTAEAGIPYLVRGSFLRKAPALPLPAKAGFPPWLRFYDVFDPAWPGACDAHAKEMLEPIAGDPYFIGYWIDNEPLLEGWYDGVLFTELDAPFRKAFVEVARAYYAEKPDQFAKDWAQHNLTQVDDLLKVEGKTPNVPELKLAWEAAVAEKAFSTIAAACKKYAPNHLNFGVRMMSGMPPSPGVLKAMGKHCDIISMNLYSILPDRLLTQMFTIVPYIHSVSGVPVMVSEFSYRGEDTPHPNTIGAPPSVPTQLDRGIGYMSYISAVASMPLFIGASWYTYMDDEPHGDWAEYDEDSNFGVVDRQDRPYAVLSETMRLTNSAIYELAANPERNEECQLFWRTELMRWDRDWDTRFLQRFARTPKPIPDPFAQMLPAPRRFHESYWIRHTGPEISINTEDFVGHCDAHMIWREADWQQLALFGVHNFTTFPRKLWYGAECEKPEDPLLLESNARLLVRRLDNAGHVLRMTLVDGSFVRLGFAEFVLRTDQKVPYLDLRFDPEKKAVSIVARGPLAHVGVHDIAGWSAQWEGIPVQPIQFPAPPELTVFAPPEH